MARVGLSKRTRFEVFKRDSFSCQYCGKSAPDVVLHVDHIVPVADGGKNAVTNLITACADCNLGKSSVPLDDQAAVAKQMRQLKELNERREQIQMIAKWHQSLVDLDAEQLKAVESRIHELSGFGLSPFGGKKIKAAIKKYGLQAVLAATETSAAQYLKVDGDKAQAEKFIDYIPRICFWEREKAQNPDGAKIGHICAIASKKGFKCHRSAVWKIVTDAHNRGVPLDAILSLVRECSGIMAFEDGIDELVAIHDVPTPEEMQRLEAEIHG